MTTEQKKPYDLGNGLRVRVVRVDGSWLSVGMAHPRAGLVELSGAPAFPAERDGEVDLVRAHRAGLTDPASRDAARGGHALRVVAQEPSLAACTGPAGRPA